MVVNCIGSVNCEILQVGMTHSQSPSIFINNLPIDKDNCYSKLFIMKLTICVYDRSYAGILSIRPMRHREAMLCDGRAGNAKLSLTKSRPSDMRMGPTRYRSQRFSAASNKISQVHQGQLDYSLCVTQIWNSFIIWGVKF